MLVAFFMMEHQGEDLTEVQEGAQKRGVNEKREFSLVLQTFILLHLDWGHFALISNESSVLSSNFLRIFKQCDLKSFSTSKEREVSPE